MSMKRIKLIVWSTRLVCWASILLLFTSCSRVYPFFIVNHTGAPLKIDVELAEDREIFPIFFYPNGNGGAFSLYEMRSATKVDFGTKSQVQVDTLDHFAHYEVKIPANTAFEFGRLSNQRYERYDQDFMNGRKFNLEHIHSASHQSDIKPENFDELKTVNQSGVLLILKK